MSHRRLPFHALLLGIALGSTLGCSHKAADEAPTFTIRAAGLKMPELDGWMREDAAGDTENGGAVFRLVRSNAIPGSPRIEVVLEPKSEKPTHIDDFLTRNLRDMAALEEAGKIRISDVSQRPVMVGPRRAYRVRHEYMLAGTQSAITQISTFLVLDGRGIAVTAVGRTELLQPYAESIELMFNGLQAMVDSGGHAEGGSSSPLTRPIDLGKVGGN
jgi:hypothetical protein